MGTLARHRQDYTQAVEMIQVVELPWRMEQLDSTDVLLSVVHLADEYPAEKIEVEAAYDIAVVR